MEFIADSEEFARAFGRAVRAAHKQSGVLSNVLIEANDSVVSATGSRGVPLSLTTTIEAEVLEDGEVLIPVSSASLVSPIGKTVADCSIKTVDDKTLSVEVQNRNIVIPTVKGSYPDLPDGRPEFSFMLEAEEIESAKHALGHADQNDKTSAHSGLFVTRDGKFMGGATYISACMQNPDAFSEDGVALSSEGLNEALRVAKSEGLDEIDVGVSGGSVRYDIGEQNAVFGSVFAKDWPVKFVPHALGTEFDVEIQVEREEIVEVLDHCMGLHERAAKSSAAMYPITLSAEKESVGISIASQSGSLNTDLVATVSGDPLSRACSPEFILKAVRSTVGRVSIFLSSDDSVNFFKVQGSDNPKRVLFVSRVRPKEEAKNETE